MTQDTSNFHFHQPRRPSILIGELRIFEPRNGQVLITVEHGTNTGEAAIYAPMDVGLPSDGVLTVNAPGETWAVAELPLSRLERAASKSQVAVDSDWPQQLRPGLLRAGLHRLG